MSHRVLTGSPRTLDLRLMVPVFVVVTLDAANTSAILPVLPFFLRDLGATPVVLGLVLAAEGLSQFLAAPWLGQLSDRFDRKKILLTSQAGALVSLALLAAADTIASPLDIRTVLRSWVEGHCYGVSTANRSDNAVRPPRQCLYRS